MYRWWKNAAISKSELFLTERIRFYIVLALVFALDFFFLEMQNEVLPHEIWGKSYITYNLTAGKIPFSRRRVVQKLRPFTASYAASTEADFVEQPYFCLNCCTVQNQNEADYLIFCVDVCCLSIAGSFSTFWCICEEHRWPYTIRPCLWEVIEAVEAKEVVLPK